MLVHFSDKNLASGGNNFQNLNQNLYSPKLTVAKRQKNRYIQGRQKTSYKF